MYRSLVITDADNFAKVSSWTVPSQTTLDPRSRTVSQLWTTDDPTESDRYDAVILDSVVRAPNQIIIIIIIIIFICSDKNTWWSIFVGLIELQTVWAKRLLQAVDTSSAIIDQYGNTEYQAVVVHLSVVCKHVRLSRKGIWNVCRCGRRYSSSVNHQPHIKYNINLIIMWYILVCQNLSSLLLKVCVVWFVSADINNRILEK